MDIANRQHTGHILVRVKTHVLNTIVTRQTSVERSGTFTEVRLFKAQPANDFYLYLLRRISNGEKKPAGGGLEIGILSSNEKKAYLIVRANDLPGSIQLCRYIL